MDLAIRNGRIWQEGTLVETNLYIKKGIIERIGPEELPASKVLDASGAKVFPGVIDPHVHFDLDIGKAVSSDSFASGSAAGLYGGVTTYIDFLDPVNKAKDAEPAFERRMDQAAGSQSDFSFHLTAANPAGETDSLAEEAIRLKIPSVKIFTAYSESDRRTYDNEIAQLLELSAERGFVLLVHAEDEDCILQSPELRPAQLSRSRPVDSELSMLRKLADISSKKGGRLYMVHTTCGESLRILSEEYPKLWNRNFFLESCPQYFYFDDSRFLGPDGYRYVLAPPLRPAAEQQKLKELANRLFSIGTDHCPFMLDEKKQTLLKDIPFGIGGIEFSFPLMHRCYGDSIIDRMSRNPARLFGLYPRKGVLQEGASGDLFIFREGEEYPIRENHSRCDYNNYQNITLKGRVETTVLRGEIRMDRGRLIPGKGQFIPREAQI